MNQHISGANAHVHLNPRAVVSAPPSPPGGWKYLNPKTGEFFHGMDDLREKLKKIIRNADIKVHTCGPARVHAQRTAADSSACTPVLLALHACLTRKNISRFRTTMSLANGSGAITATNTQVCNPFTTTLIDAPGSV